MMGHLTLTHFEHLGVFFGVFGCLFAQPLGRVPLTACLMFLGLYPIYFVRLSFQLSFSFFILFCAFFAPGRYTHTAKFWGEFCATAGAHGGNFGQFDLSSLLHPRSFTYSPGYSHIAEFWGEMFESQLGPIPDEIVRDCCGQHALSRPAILCYSS